MTHLSAPSSPAAHCPTGSAQSDLALSSSTLVSIAPADKVVDYCAQGTGRSVVQEPQGSCYENLAELTVKQGCKVVLAGRP